MSYWICCNACFLSPSADRKLALTTCGHVVCSVCYRQGMQGRCLICNHKCQVSPLSDRSSSEVKALFSDITVVANKGMTEVSKVIMFQARHQKRLLTHYQQKNEKLQDALVKMKYEMQQMTKKLNEQSAYISKLEGCLQHQSVKASSVSQRSHSSHTTHGPQKPVFQIPYSSPVCLSRLSSSLNVNENMEVVDRSLYRKPTTGARLSLISPPQDEQMGAISQSLSNQNILNRSARSATVSRFQGAPVSPGASYSRSPGWTSPIFRSPHSFRYSMSPLVQLPSFCRYEK